MHDWFGVQLSVRIVRRDHDAASWEDANSATSPVRKRYVISTPEPQVHLRRERSLRMDGFAIRLGAARTRAGRRFFLLHVSTKRDQNSCQMYSLIRMTAAASRPRVMDAR